MGGACCNWSLLDQTFSSVLSVADSFFSESCRLPPRYLPLLEELFDWFSYEAAGVVSITACPSAMDRVAVGSGLLAQTVAVNLAGSSLSCFELCQLVVVTLRLSDADNF